MLGSTPPSEPTYGKRAVAIVYEPRSKDLPWMLGAVVCLGCAWTAPRIQ